MLNATKPSVKLLIVMLSVSIMNAIKLSLRCAECHYAECKAFYCAKCHYGEWHYAEPEIC
jgi:hypothetical protein